MVGGSESWQPPGRRPGPPGLGTWPPALHPGLGSQTGCVRLSAGASFASSPLHTRLSARALQPCTRDALSRHTASLTEHCYSESPAPSVGNNSCSRTGHTLTEAPFVRQEPSSQTRLSAEEDEEFLEGGARRKGCLQMQFSAAASETELGGKTPIR